MKKYTLCLFALASALVASCFANSPIAFIEREKAEEYPTFRHQGEYLGSLSLEAGELPVTFALQIAAYGENTFRVRLHRGGFPWEPGFVGSLDEGGTLKTTLADGVLTLTGFENFQFVHEGADKVRVFLGSEEIGQLQRVARVSPTLGKPAPAGAVVLFDGGHLDQWKEGAEISSEGWLKQGAYTRNEFGDMQLHLEAKLGFMPENRNQRRANSGIYIQNRYEVQILDSFAVNPAPNSNAALYMVHPPRINPSLPPLSWQTYDVFFRAPRFEDGVKTENARLTVYLNGILMHDDVELERGTGRGGRREEVERAELYLQGHTGPVRFRNVWLVADKYDPPGSAVLEP